ncbi:MAG: nicotinate phosphoribosyltransferase [Pseudomonadota bacterium]|jgi:nicotinate phosphoribosyltransferase
MDALVTDLYQFTMLDAYLAEGLHDTAVFELFVRRLPPGRPVLVAAGLEPALEWLQRLRFEEAELDWLAQHAGLHARTLQWLREFRFTGDVDAVPEGTPVFADEPLLRVHAPLPQAQVVESRLLNLVHLSTLVASKAARVVAAAQGRTLVDFGMRRAHGAEAAVLGARAAYLAGFDGTATVEAARRWGIPVYGTMAHSYVQAHDDEATAFEAFVHTRPVRPTLLVDTYDTLRGVGRVAALARKLAPQGRAIAGVRLDSGDLLALARASRRILDEAGAGDVTIFASGDLDEHRIEALLASGAPLDGFGVGTALTTSRDVPALDMVYKLQAYARRPRRKRSPGKATWPGERQVWRETDGEGTMRRDLVSLADEPPPASGTGPATRWTSLLEPCLREGRLVRAHPSLAAVRAAHVQAMRTLPVWLRTAAHAPGAAGGQPTPTEPTAAPGLSARPTAPVYPVDISVALRAAAARDDATAGGCGAGPSSNSRVSASRAPACTISASARAPSPGCASTAAMASPSSTTS